MNGVGFRANFRMREKGMWGLLSVLTTQHNINNPSLVFFPLSFCAYWQISFHLRIVAYPVFKGQHYNIC